MLTQPVLVFDIETIPDIAFLRQRHQLPDSLSDAAVYDITQRLARQNKGTDFLPHHQHRIACISCLLRTPDTYKIFTLPHTAPFTDEREAISVFFALIDKYQPTLVSWNGGGFDLPVLHYRALKHNIAAPTYWRDEGEFKWDSYTSRYHKRHTDLMDLLALYQPRAWSGLNDIALLCGLPGKIGIGGGNVWTAWQAGQITPIRDYCETDALITYLLYLRYLHFSGKIDQTTELPLIRQYLETNPTRWGEFLSAWHPD